MLYRHLQQHSLCSMISGDMEMTPCPTCPGMICGCPCPNWQTSLQKSLTRIFITVSAISSVFGYPAPLQMFYQKKHLKHILLLCIYIWGRPGPGWRQQQRASGYGPPPSQGLEAPRYSLLCPCTGVAAISLQGPQTGSMLQWRMWNKIYTVLGSL